MVLDTCGAGSPPAWYWAVPRSTLEEAKWNVLSRLDRHQHHHILPSNDGRRINIVILWHWSRLGLCYCWQRRVDILGIAWGAIIPATAMEGQLSGCSEGYWQLLGKHAYPVWRVHDKWSNKLGEVSFCHYLIEPSLSYAVLLAYVIIILCKRYSHSENILYCLI